LNKALVIPNYTGEMGELYPHIVSFTLTLTHENKSLHLQN